MLNNFEPFRNVRVKETKGLFRVLTPELFKELKGKVVEMRSPMFCREKGGLCKKCMGEIYKYNGIVKNLSAYPTNLSSDVMMKSMKSFHDLEGSFTKINFRKELLGL